MYNYTVGRVWGIPIRINISLLIVLPIFAWLIGSGAQIELYAGLLDSFTTQSIALEVLLVGNRPWVIGTVAAIGLFVSVAVHELGHSWVAMRYDIEVESITLWILGGLASLKSMPKEWDREFWIAIAGPITSVLFAIACFGLIQVLSFDATPVVFFVVGWLGVVNLLLAGFNLLPAFPMDGGRIFRSLLARNRPYGVATRVATRVGKWFAFAFAIFGILGGAPMLLLLALFIYIAAASESKAAVLDELLEGLTVGDLTTTSESLPATASVGEVLDRLLESRRSDLPIMGADGTIEGTVSASAIRSVDPANYTETTAKSLIQTDLPRIDATTSAFEGLLTLDRSRSTVALVERDGRVIGLLSRAEYTRLLEFRRESGSL